MAHIVFLEKSVDDCNGNMKINNITVFELPMNNSFLELKKATGVRKYA